MTNNIHRGDLIGVSGYIPDRYDRPNPRVTLDVAIEEKKLTLGTLRHLVDKATNFADDARIALTPELIRVIQESTKPVEMEYRGNGHLHFEAGEHITKPGAPTTTKIVQHRDAKGRFMKPE